MHENLRTFFKQELKQKFASWKLTTFGGIAIAIADTSAPTAKLNTK